jgi:hypothetical protein
MDKQQHLSCGKDAVFSFLPKNYLERASKGRKDMLSFARQARDPRFFCGFETTCPGQKERGREFLRPAG